MATPTLPPSATDHGTGRDPGQVPGVAVVFSGGAPGARVIRLGPLPIELGRDPGAGQLDDGRISRRHAAVAFGDGHCIVTDLGSRNGTFVDGEQVAAHTSTRVRCVIRVGDSLLVPYHDVRPLEDAGVARIDGFVRGPAMRAVLDDAGAAARAGTPLHVRGESGSGKEGVVQAYHRASGRAGAVVPVNCAAIPHALAERLLFGVKRGAYSGAEADASGYIQDAEGGTLFLDEIAELDLQVQAKLLRVLESRELMPLGASKPRRVDFALCSATNKDLRALVASGAWREDLYFRIARPAVTLPPLRNRPEEIPALVADELAGQSTPATAHVSLIEQCLLRPWPGNVRELLAEIRAAAQAAHAEGSRVTSRHLPASAGTLFGTAASGMRTPPPEPASAAYGSRTPPPEPASAAYGSRTPPPELVEDPPIDDRRRRVTRDPDETRRQIVEALVANGCNVAATARALRLHRTQLRRLIEQHGIVVSELAGDGARGDEGSTGDDED